MKSQSKQLRTDIYWLAHPPCSGAFHKWLVDSGSLTARLTNRCSDFAVKHVHQYWAKPSPDEAALLGLQDGQTALIREVWLQDGITPLVFARSILPRHSLSGVWCKLGDLGNRPLGAALFADAGVVRQPLAFRKLSAHHPLRRHAPQAKWARRSIFIRDGRSILVTEAFLPAVLDLPA
ncbi:MAG TPA: chorismate lyase [Methylophilaceae bacterium]